MKPDFTKAVEFISDKSKKGYVAIIGIVGILLIFIGDMDISAPKAKGSVGYYSLQEYTTQLEKETESLLAEIEGVGEVKVMITMESDKENIYVQQEKSTTDSKENHKGEAAEYSSHNTFKNEVVIIKDAGGDTHLVEKTVQPTVMGVAVVCQGAGDINVVADITNTVSVVLGVPTHKIFVTKMR